MPKRPASEGHRHDSARPGSRWASLPTEARHPRSGGLDRMSGEEIVALLLDEDRRGLEAAGRLSREVAVAADWIAETFAGGGTI
ncbi:MAG: hypothetical protein GY778_00125, partial [bacterium]|nr:hypothetical protein [bacterium]